MEKTRVNHKAKLICRRRITARPFPRQIPLYIYLAPPLIVHICSHNLFIFNCPHIYIIMSFRAPNLIRSTVGRRAGQTLNLRSQVIRRRFATEGGPEIVSSFISLVDCNILLNRTRPNHLLHDRPTLVISSQVSVLLPSELHITSTAPAGPSTILPIKLIR